MGFMREKEDHTMTMSASKYRYVNTEHTVGLKKREMFFVDYDERKEDLSFNRLTVSPASREFVNM